MTNQHPQHNEPLLTYAQAAALLNLRLGTLYSLVSRREIPHVRLGRRVVRFRRDVLIAFINEHAIDANRSSGV